MTRQTGRHQLDATDYRLRPQWLQFITSQVGKLFHWYFLETNIVLSLTNTGTIIIVVQYEPELHTEQKYADNSTDFPCDP